MISRNSYLTKYGGTTSNTYQITTQNLTTDNLIVKGNVYGIVQFDRAVFNSILTKSINITGNVTIPEPYNLTVGGNIYLKDSLIFSKTGIAITTNINGNGLDFIGGQTTLNTIAHNSYGYGVQAGANVININTNIGYSYIYFYNNNNLNSTYPADSTIISTDNHLQVNNNLLVYNQNNSNGASVAINDFSANYLTQNTSLVYSPDSTKSPYYHSIYENTGINMGNAETLITANNSVTFLNINTQNMANGMRLGGGVYPNTPGSTSQSVSSLEIRDICGNYKPIQTVITGSDPVINPATMGINTYFPNKNYTLDINGSAILHNTQVEKVLYLDYSNTGITMTGNVFTTFLNSSISTGIMSYYSQNIIGSTIPGITNPYNSNLNIYYTHNSGKKWYASKIYPYPINILNTNISISIPKTSDISKSIIYDSSSSIISTGGSSYLNTAVLYASTTNGYSYNQTYADTNIVQCSSLYFIYGVDYNTNVITFAGDNNINSISTANSFCFYDIDSSFNITVNTSLSLIASSINNIIFNTSYQSLVFTSILPYYILPTTTVDCNNSNTNGINYVLFLNYSSAVNSSSTISTVYMNIYDTANNYNYPYTMITTLDPGVNSPNTNLKIKMRNNICMIYNTYIISFDITTLVVGTGGSATVLSTSLYTTWQNSNISSIYDISLLDSNIATAGCNGSQLLTTTNSGSSWSIIKSFANYGGHLFDTTTAAFTTVYMTDTNNFFISKMSANKSLAYFYSYNPYLFNSKTYNIMDICGNISVYGNINASGTVLGSQILGSSDYRIKENVVPLTEDMLFLDHLNPVHYRNTLTNREDFGLIAHELQRFYPELVVGEKDGNATQAVNYMGLISILIKEIQLLKARVSSLE